MVTDNGGWTLISWNLNTNNNNLGVPYPGNNVCTASNLACDLGSSLNRADMQSLIQASSSFGQSFSVNGVASVNLNMTDYEKAGEYSYNDLSSILLTAGTGQCTDGIIGTYNDLKATSFGGTTLYLDLQLRYQNYDHSSNDYIWNIGVPENACSGSGSAPGSWMGPWAQQQYGVNGQSNGAFAVWVR
jgi:hypothetical protein